MPTIRTANWSESRVTVESSGEVGSGLVVAVVVGSGDGSELAVSDGSGAGAVEEGSTVGLGVSEGSADGEGDDSDEGDGVTNKGKPPVIKEDVPSHIRPPNREARATELQTRERKRRRR